MVKTIAVANQKGGVGKTTTTFNLGAYLGQQGHRVLLVDFDPQGNLSSYAGYEPGDGKPTMSDLLSYMIMQGNKVYTRDEEKHGNYFASSIHNNAVEKIDYIPSTIILSGAEQSLIGCIDRERYLSNLLLYLQDAYDYILIDCPPSLGILSINALTACDEVLIPVQAQNFALDGIVQLIDTIERVKVHLNPNMKINGFLLTMVKHTNMSRDVIEALTFTFGDLVYETKIADSTDAPTSSKDQVCLKGKLGKQYSCAAEEFINR